MAKNYYDWRWLAFASLHVWCNNWRTRGHCDSDALHVSLNSVIDLNPDSTLSVFGGSETNLRTGLETLLGVLNASSRRSQC